jgi:hypothetical protein
MTLEIDYNPNIETSIYTNFITYNDHFMGMCNKNYSIEKTFELPDTFTENEIKYGSRMPKE